MASSQLPSEDDGPDRNATLHVHDVVKEDASKSDDNGSDENSSEEDDSEEDDSEEDDSEEDDSEEDDSEEDDSEEDDSEEDDSEEEESEEDESDEDDTEESESHESDSGDDDSFTSCDEVKLRIPTAEDFDNLPFRVTTCGPPHVDTKLYTDIMRFFFNPIRCFWEPIWIIQPDIDIITNMIRPYARLCGLSNEDISVEFLSEGSWNRVYVVSSVNKSSQCVFRCALPSNPWFRMQLEVSTMDYVRTHTTIPVPKVFAFNSSMKNPLGLEWMLMEKVNGITYAEALKNNTITFDAEVQLHRTVADWVHQLSQLTFSQMGCLYRRWDLPITDPDAFVLGPLNDWEYIVDIRPDLDTYRGPFASKADFITSLIALRIAESAHPRIRERADYFAARRAAAAARNALPPGADTSTVPMTPAADEVFSRSANHMYTHDTISNVPKYALALQSLLPLCAAATAPFDGADPNRSTYLYHNDIHAGNIMVDGSGRPIALLDWEGVYACPHDWTQRYPPVIDEEDYPHPDDMDADTDFPPLTPDQRREAEAAYRFVVLRRAYEERLREWGSAAAREREVDEDLDGIVDRVFRIDRCYGDWGFVEGVRDRQMKELLGVTRSKV